MTTWDRTTATDCTRTSCTPRARLLAPWLALAALLPARAHAHEFRPGVLLVDLGADGELTIRVELPPEHRERPPTLELPPSCRPLRPAPYLRAACDTAPDDLIMIKDLAPELELVAHLRRPGEPVHTSLVHAGAPTLALNPGVTTPDLAGYLALGVEHILGGLDHLLFVAGLVLWVRGALAVLATLTAFTAAHSLTLALAALDLVRLPGPPVEACIAVSLVLLARAVARGDLPRRTPWRFAFACGLLHGFGFAGALAEIGLPEQALLPALAAFNLGVELGQLLAAALLVVLLALLASRAPRLPIRRVLAYAIGGLACAWTLARVLALGAPS